VFLVSSNPFLSQGILIELYNYVCTVPIPSDSTVVAHGKGRDPVLIEYWREIHSAWM